MRTSSYVPEHLAETATRDEVRGHRAGLLVDIDPIVSGWWASALASADSASA